MKARVFHIVAALLACAVWRVPGQAVPAGALEGLTWAAPDRGAAAMAALTAAGEAGARDLAMMLKEPGGGDDTTVRFAIEGLCMHVMRPGAEAERLAAAKGFGAALARAEGPEAKAYLIRRLQAIGKAESVPVLAGFLSDDRFVDPAAAALTAIGGDAAATALLGALPGTEGACAATLIRALGDLRTPSAAGPIRGYADSADRDVRTAVWYALSRIGDPGAVPILAQAARAEGVYLRSTGMRAYLTLAARLAETGQTEPAAAICRDAASLARDGGPAARTAALAAVLQTTGAEAALGTLLDAVASAEIEVMEGILALLEELPGEAVTRACAERSATGSVESRAALIAMLGRRADPAAIPAVKAGLSAGEVSVQVAAAGALPAFGHDAAVLPLVALAAGEAAEVGDEAAAVLRRIRSEGLAPAVTRALPGASAVGQVRLLELAAERPAGMEGGSILPALSSGDAKVRKAGLAAMAEIGAGGDVPALLALVDAGENAGDRRAVAGILAPVCRRDPSAVQTVLAGVGKAGGETKAALLGVLPRIGGADALAAVVGTTGDADEGIRDAAVRALADWPDGAAGAPLLALATDSDSPIHRVLALRGYVRLAGAAGDPEARVAMLGKALAAAGTAADRRLVLGGLGEVKTDASVALVLPLLGDAEIREDAAACLVAIICPGEGNVPGIRSAASTAALRRVVEVSQTPAVAQKAAAFLASAPPAGVNVGMNRPVKTSCPQQTNRVPENAVDGVVDQSSAWFGDRWPSSLEVDLESVLPINGIRAVFWWDGNRLYQYTVEVSEDGKEWRQVVDNAENKAVSTPAGYSHTFAPVAARYVRLNILKNSVNEAVHVVEFEVYSDSPQARVKRKTDAANLAMGRPVSVSCTVEEPQFPELANDGDVNLDSCYWGGGTPSTYVVDLEQSASIDTVRAMYYWDGGRYYQYTVDISADGEAWKTVVDNSGNTKVSDPYGVVHRFDPVEARYVRLNTLKNSANPSVHIVEFEVYAAGKAPQQFPSSVPPRPAAPPPLPPPDAEGFVSLFNGTDLTGWIGSVDGYAVEDGVMYCRADGGGKLLTANEFGDFILRFEFRMPEGANNGLAIRAPEEGNAAYNGMELQIIDNVNYEKVHNYKLQPWQVHGSIYGVVPAKTGALKPVGEWNVQEVRALGPVIQVILNDTVIVDADLSTLTETADGQGLDKHPGLQNHKGHIGWLGHGARVEFRDIRIKPFEPYTVGPHNTPPPGFTAAFNGTDLTGWKGLAGDPESRAKMTPAQLQEAQAKADESMRAHWKVEDGTLVFDGKGQSLCTAKDYGDFEFYVDWKILPHGDSGIYLRGSPQVQIWDPGDHPEGSGGLYNNQKNPRSPSVCADNPIGQWNRFFIRMVGEKVTVRLNGTTVVEDVVMENYWDRSKPIYPVGQIELQNHGNTLYFRNVYVRELD